MRIDRRLASLVSVVATWAALWGVAGAAVSIVAGIVDPAVVGPGEGPVALAGIVGVAGAGAGLVFALLLATVEHGRDLEDVALPRAAAWGLVAGAALPVLALVDANPSNTIVLGVGAAILTVLLARASRGPSPARA